MIGWHLAPLPDFLEDHTLTGREAALRLKEQATRWVQFVASLWSWKARATFAIRYVARESEVHVYLLASAKVSEDLAGLMQEMEVRLRAYRLIDDPERLRLFAERIEVLCNLPKPAIVEVHQLATRSLWSLPDRVSKSPQYRSHYDWMRDEDWREPMVVYPWWGPGGPFLIPMEGLISLGVPASLTVYLEPTVLTRQEWDWLALMAREATSLSDQSLHALGASASVRVQDPCAGLAGRLYMANLRRLSATPFLVAAHCCASDGRADVAHALAGTLQALVHEEPFERPQQEEQHLPSGAWAWGSTMPPEPPLAPVKCRRLSDQHNTLWFPDLEAPDSGVRYSLARMPYLADAQGAATLFRLPVSVRGGVPGIRVKQLPPDFHPGERFTQCPKASLDLGSFHSGGRAVIHVDDLTKHVLVTGFTGTGKTVTVLQLLHQLWLDHNVPFLVIESAKKEYRGMVTVEAMRAKSPLIRVYTLGNELCAPMRINPFQLLPGVRVEGHLSRLQPCFEASIPPLGPSSSVIAEALLRAYASHGWSLTDVYPESGEARRTFPTLSDFVREVENVLADRQYQGEVRSNLRAALLGRLRPLLIGSKGCMFDTPRCDPSFAELLSGPVIIELNDLNLDDKALAAMFLLTLLREYRELRQASPGHLCHITVVEEAHNVLENVASAGSSDTSASVDTRYKAVQTFCSLLTEIRALGEGLVIADQSPEKLARDAVRNTNLQIAHQLRDARDRAVIAEAMIMDEPQRDYLGKLPPGRAALFQTGFEKATFVTVEPYYDDHRGEATPREEQHAPQPQGPRSPRGAGYSRALGDRDLLAYMLDADPQLKSRRHLILPFPDCVLCRRQCDYRDAVYALILEPRVLAWSREWFASMTATTAPGETPNRTLQWESMARMTISCVREVGLEESLDACWCCFIHMLYAGGGAGRGVPRDADRALVEQMWQRLDDHLARLQQIPSGRAESLLTDRPGRGRVGRSETVLPPGALEDGVAASAQF